MKEMLSLMQLTEFKKFLEIQKERQLATKELSEILGIDISFSDKEVIQNAEQSFVKAYQKQINKEVNEWMKSLSL
tara:strand:+ start:396 stop:620 length:225 start_codon:yes stop_codon:yes gene_type:complete